jgi:ATP-dependent DNA helicase RecG
MPKVLRLADLPENSTAEELLELLGGLEHEQLEFKKGAPSNLANTIASMAMTDGGLVVLGVTDDRKVVGCPLSQASLDAVRRGASQVGVDVQMKEIQVDRHKLTVVAVPDVRGRIVTTPDGRLLRRSGSDNVPLVADAMARFVQERTGRPAEDEVIARPQVDDFDLELINGALAADQKKPVRRGDVVRALVDLGVATPSTPPADVNVLVAAAVLFAYRPNRYVPAATVQVVRRTGVGPGPGPTADRRELNGPIPRLLDEVLAFIAKNTTSHEAVVGRRRERVPEYPIAVLREALLNALSHRDYGLSGATVDVTIWDDRVEIRSPGPLPGHITLDNIRDEHYSRNRRVMHVLKLLGLVEEYGEGVDRMYRELEERLMEPPLFTATASSVTVTVQSRSLLGVEDQAWLALVGHFDLSPHERRILVLARHYGSITRRQVRAMLPDTDAQALLAGAVAKGLLVMTGERGGSRYHLSDEVVLRAGAASLEARSRQKQMLLDELRRRGSLSTTEAMEFLGESNIVLVRHLLNDLVRARLATARGKTRARRYHRT